MSGCNNKTETLSYLQLLTDTIGSNNTALTLNERHGISNHQQLWRLLNIFMLMIKKASEVFMTVVCKDHQWLENSPRKELETWRVFSLIDAIMDVDAKWNLPDHQPAIGLIQYIPRNMHTVFALLCFVVVIHWLIIPYPSGLLHWHCGNLTIAPVPAKQPWWIWINTSCEFIMNDCITTTKQSTTKPYAYFLGYTVPLCHKV